MRHLVCSSFLVSCIVLGPGCSQDWDSLEPDGTAGSGDAAVGGAGGSGASGGSAGSTGGSAGSTGGSAGSTGGSAGSTGGSAGSAGAGPVSCDDPDGVVWDGNGHCYFPSGGEKNWEAHRDACASDGAYLVTITSKQEQDFVKALLEGQERWIGLRRQGNGEFTWITGEPFDYDNWGQGEPNEQGDACVRLRENDQWADRGCDNEYRAICERE